MKINEKRKIGEISTKNVIIKEINR